MKNKAVKTLLCLSMTAMLGLGSTAAVTATQTEETKTEGTEEAAEDKEETKPEGETDAGEEKVPEDVTVSLITGEVVLKNETSRFFAGAEYKKAESKVVENAEVSSQGGEMVAQTWDLVLTEEEGTVHTFKDVRTDKWAEPRLTEQLGMLYIEYLDEAAQKQEAFEEAEEKNLEAPVPVYATTEVNIRETPDTASQSLKVTKAGEEWSAVAVLPGWIKVEGNGTTGYVHHEYVTENKEAVSAAQNTEQSAAPNTTQPQTQQSQTNNQAPQTNYQEPQYNAPTAQEPEPQAPAVQEPEPQTPSEPADSQEPSEPEDSGDVTEISREDFPNESGDGHGTYEITYSDGSVIYQDY